MTPDPHTCATTKPLAELPDHPLPRVAVLLASYNGLAYIPEQVASILAQKSCVVHLHVSDDHSSDGTWDWLRERAQNEPRIELLPRTDRFGNAARNFYRLLRDTDFSKYDFVALSDQDDIWLENKLALCIEKLQIHDAAAASSNVIAVWADGRTKLIEKSQRQRRLDFLFGSAGPGCTYLLTAACAMRLSAFLVENRAEVEKVQFHDWMIYAWVRSHGLKWHIEATPTMLYRQHDTNEYGANSGWTAFKRRLAQVNSGWYREQILRISQLVSKGSTFTTECAAITQMIQTDTIVSRGRLLGKLPELRREMKDRTLLVLAFVLGRV